MTEDTKKWVKGLFAFVVVMLVLGLAAHGLKLDQKVFVLPILVVAGAVAVYIYKRG